MMHSNDHDYYAIQTIEELRKLLGANNINYTEIRYRPGVDPFSEVTKNMTMLAS